MIDSATNSRLKALHNAGQTYTGGPGGGTFLTITREPDADPAVPGSKASIGTGHLAQAKGDMTVLAGHGNKVARVHLETSGDCLAALGAKAS